MDPKIESMRLAIKLLCCANEGPDGGEYIFPGSRPVAEGDTVDPDWQDLLNALFAISDQIYQRLI